MAVRVRVVADPSIGVSDLEQVLTTFLDEHDVGGKKANLFEYLRPPTGCHWKSSPTLATSLESRSCSCHYCQLAPNGVLPAKKHKQAIQAVDCQRSLNQTKKSPEDFSDMLDDWVRMSLSHCRSLRSCETAKARCFRRADTAPGSSLGRGPEPLDWGRGGHSLYRLRQPWSRSFGGSCYSHVLPSQQTSLDNRPGCRDRWPEH